MSHRIFVGKDVHKFSSAHMSVFPDGTKERLHGHNFQVSAAFALRSTATQDMLDFAVVKRCLVELCAALDQRLLLPERSPRLTLHPSPPERLDFSLCGQRYNVPREDVALLPLDNVVVETLAEYLARTLAALMGPALSPRVVSGLELTVTESRNQGASYHLTLNAESTADHA